MYNLLRSRKTELITQHEMSAAYLEVPTVTMKSGSINKFRYIVGRQYSARVVQIVPIMVVNDQLGV